MHSFLALGTVWEVPEAVLDLRDEESYDRLGTLRGSFPKHHLV